MVLFRWHPEQPPANAMPWPPWQCRFRRPIRWSSQNTGPQGTAKQPNWNVHGCQGRAHWSAKTLVVSLWKSMVTDTSHILHTYFTHTLHVLHTYFMHTLHILYTFMYTIFSGTATRLLQCDSAFVVATTIPRLSVARLAGLSCKPIRKHTTDLCMATDGHLKSGSLRQETEGRGEAFTPFDLAQHGLTSTGLALEENHSQKSRTMTKNLYLWESDYVWLRIFISAKVPIETQHHVLLPHRSSLPGSSGAQSSAVPKSEASTIAGSGHLNNSPEMHWSNAPFVAKNSLSFAKSRNRQDI